MSICTILAYIKRNQTRVKTMKDTIFLILFVGSAIGIVGWCVYVMGMIEAIKNDLRGK